MRIAAVRLFLFAFITFAISGCGKPARRYEFQGRVIEKFLETRTLVIDHPEIPDFMPAMTMPYRVSQDIDIANVEPGDKISARIVVRGDGNYELDQLKVTDSSGRGAASAPATRERPLSVGERIPNVDLLNQDGRVIRLSDSHGKTVLLTFIYTRCPMPNFCPRLSSLFASVQRELAKRPPAVLPHPPRHCEHRSQIRFSAGIAQVRLGVSERQLARFRSLVLHRAVSNKSEDARERLRVALRGRRQSNRAFDEHRGDRSQGPARKGMENERLDANRRHRGNEAG